MSRTLKALVLACTVIAASQSAARAGELVVVELFTSQGCSSCPPADALLTELSRRDGVLALSFHVNYWDYIGWKDPFASVAATERQRGYTRPFGLSYVYTPQMVIQGRRQMTGSDRRGVLEGIAREADLPRLKVEIAGDASGAAAVLPARDGAETSTLWAISFDYAHTTRIERGENGGRTLAYSNVVRDIRRIGSWRGEAAWVPLPMSELAAGRDAVALLVQADTSGAILGAAVLGLTDRP
ncbi:MAG: DUF1223 domain-containing protein [Rhodospirillales bacterium]|nr:DUF1223 domain-containing protein [Rhodospirillales bacterium]